MFELIAPTKPKALAEGMTTMSPTAMVHWVTPSGDVQTVPVPASVQFPELPVTATVPVVSCGIC